MNSLKHAYDYIKNLNSFVVKPIGLTGGKGVKVINKQNMSFSDIKNYIFNILKKTSIVIEEEIIGEEYTLQAFVDGSNLVFCPLVKDHKRLLCNNKGENTGGMGAYTDINHLLPFIDENIITKSKEIMVKTIKYIFKETGVKYKGILYGQFIVTKEKQIKLIEYNARFGDPEAINTLSLLKTDLFEICISIINENLNRIKILFDNKATVCKYLVPKCYPSCSDMENLEIIIHDNYIHKDIDIYYANVNCINNKILTTNSRSIAILARSSSITEAESLVENFIQKNLKTNLYHREDIGKTI